MFDYDLIRTPTRRGYDMTGDGAPLDLDQVLELVAEAYRENRITQYLSRRSDGSVGSTLSVELPGQSISEVQESFANVLGYVGMVHT